MNKINNPDKHHETNIIVSDGVILGFDAWFLAGIYLLKVNNRCTRTRREKCSMLTIKIPEQDHWTAGERRGHFFKSSLSLPPASQTLRH